MHFQRRPPWRTGQQHFNRRRFGHYGGVLLVVFGLCGALDLALGDETPTAALNADLSRRIDELLAAEWQKAGVQPAQPADDGELLRRLHLDTVGVIPDVWQVQSYLDDAAPDKYERLVDQLLTSPAHATHLSNVWRDMLLPRKLDPEQLAGMIGVQNWLRRQFVENRRYDRIVADLLVATGGGEAGPALFYTSLGVKPEELGMTTARLFLGLRLDCAQCHDHPFDRWKQQDFWGYAAFFARVKQSDRDPRNMQLVDASTGEVRLPDSDTVVPPRYPGGVLVAAQELGTRRQQLAIWMVSRDNPYLGRATVNLVWAQLFGRGLVEPLDDFSEQNPASHPELLQVLADAFVSSGYDLRSLYRTLVTTRAYRQSSRPAGSEEPAPELFATMLVKVLTPEQLYDSLRKVALEGAADGRDPLADPRRQAFVQKMQTQTRTATDFELGVPQALTMMNGPELGAAAEAAQSGLLRALEAPFLSDAQRVDVAFLAALARRPGEAERAKFVDYVLAQPAARRSQALGDVVWALLNCSEFTLNH